MMEMNRITGIIIDSCVSIHRQIGPGLFESVYEAILLKELAKRGLRAENQVPIPIEWDGVSFDNAFRADIVVEGKIMLELKSLEALSPTHKKRLLTYLRLSGMKIGLLLNFGAPRMKDGIVRPINGAPMG